MGDADAHPYMDGLRDVDSRRLCGCVPLGCLPDRVRRWVLSDKMLTETVLGVVAGLVLGLGLASASIPQWLNDLIAFPGTVFLRLLKMLVLPLIAGSITGGVVNLRRMGSGDDVKRITRRALSLYATTYIFALVTGLVFVSLLQPGDGSLDAADGVKESTKWQCAEEAALSAAGNATKPAAHKPTLISRITGVAYSAVPPNVFEALSSSNILGVIFFCILLATALPVNSGQQPPTTVESALISFNQIIMRLINKVLVFTPIGVFSLIVSKITAACDIFSMFTTLGMFVATVVASLTVHGGVTLLSVFYLGKRLKGGQSSIAEKSVGEFLSCFSKALVTSVATSSSAAALPVSIRCAVDFGVPKDIANFVLVLGSTVNMDGTAMYEAITALFIAQRHGKHITLDYMVLIAITGSLAAMGAAAIPSAGLVTLLTVLQAADLEEYSADIALILVVDWLLDRLRTGVNVLGDNVAVCVVAHMHEADLRAQQAHAQSAAEMTENVDTSLTAAHLKHLSETGHFVYNIGHVVSFHTVDGQLVSGGVVVARATDAAQEPPVHTYTIRHPTRGLFPGWKAEWIEIDPSVVLLTDQRSAAPPAQTPPTNPEESRSVHVQVEAE